MLIPISPISPFNSNLSPFFLVIFVPLRCMTSLNIGQNDDVMRKLINFQFKLSIF